jgi:Fic family protein
MAPFSPAPLSDDDRLVVELIDDLRSRLRFHVAEPRRWSGLLRRVMLARAIRGSNTIEGFTVTVDDAFAALDEEEPLEADAAAWAAVRGYRNAMTYILQLARDAGLRLSVDTIKSLHFMIQSYDLSKWPGRWRSGDAYVVDEDRDETVYVGPDADRVADLMEEFVRGVNDADGSMPTMVRAAMAHLNLVMIHPFKDGNGRMARGLQTLLLAQEGVTAPEFCSIEEYLGRNEHDYYAVLAEVGAGAWSPHRDTQPWIRFCLTAHFRQALSVQRRSREAEKLWTAAEAEIADAGLPERLIDPLFYALGPRRLRNSTYRQIVPDISQNVASRDLGELVRANLLAPIGEKRGRYYVAAERLRELGNSVRRQVHQQHPLDSDPYQLVAADHRVRGQEPLWPDADQPS